MMELLYLGLINELFITEVTVLYLLLKLPELSCSECSICLGLAVYHLQMFSSYSLSGS